MNEKTYGICLYILENNSVKILLCKSSSDRHHKWGFVKGSVDKGESPKNAAKREFYEESGIKISIKHFEDYFEQFNDKKDIGIWLVNVNNMTHHLSKYFDEELVLKPQYLCIENSEIRFFDIDNLPAIKDKQKFIALQVINFFNNLIKK